MNSNPMLYKKNNFLLFLKENGVNEDLIREFNDLPERIISNDIEYFLNIIVTFYPLGDTHYNFELNYYSEKEMTFLFNYKIFNDIEKSIIYLQCELAKKGFLLEGNCKER